MNAIVENHVHQAIHDAFPFEVEKFPLMGPERMETPHYGLFRTDTADCVGSAVSQRYEPHTRDDIAALCDAAIAGWNDQGMPHISCRWHHDAHVIAIRPSDD
ncbi:MAG TPA: hypothetical protein PKE25_09330, partial [Novosphingobium sp.]|nr:hypothetical protein [Novosphingobium sp.]